MSTQFPLVNHFCLQWVYVGLILLKWRCDGESDDTRAALCVCCRRGAGKNNTCILWLCALHRSVSCDRVIARLMRKRPTCCSTHSLLVVREGGGGGEKVLSGLYLRSKSFTFIYLVYVKTITIHIMNDGRSWWTIIFQ